jgi:hypothetical protein
VPFPPEGTANSGITDTIISEYYTIECLNQEDLLGLFPTYPLITKCNDTTQSTPPIYGSSYYSNESDGLYLYGYTGLGLIVPKITSITVQFKGKYYQNINHLISRLSTDHLFSLMPQSDSIYLEIPPVKILPYPIKIGEFWGFREVDGFRIAKTISGREMVSVPAGVFDAYQVRFLYDLDEDGEWDENISIVDDYAAAGLIRRFFIIKDARFIDEFGNVIAIVDLWDKYELIESGIY